ncbi:SDR family NAD(P)-dependent oxidoreductase [Gordonia sp. (in: high G+C Gram-positive bacteria)]|uniref:SDR family NAD(P)-dependent oxidoreductase n=1 Tax=unclassified Gordonia (in: high G+C Gram-positive bacteria) TaxID=2657482 RepID=UPI00261600B5|nr:SDR family NAD(P)-dependent oxidoreductase [Gordonia sp. (in: high G+C Gram-positive bacteria)]
MNWADTALDRSIVLGYSQIGYRLRASRWSDDDPQAGALADRTVIVTGATSGIGAAIAGRVADLGGEVVLVGRNQERADRVRAGIIDRNPAAMVRIEIGDVSDLGQVRDLAGRLAQHRVDALVHNAGVLPPERTESADGHESSLATHVLGPILLTDLLAPQLAESPDARVIFMSSGGMYTAELPVNDIEYHSGQYRGARAYARSKRIQTALLPIVARRWAPAGVFVAGLHPGWVDTPGVSDSLPRFGRVMGPLLRSAEQGADTAVWLLATSPVPPSGQFWHDRRSRPLHYLKRTQFSEEDRISVWRDVRVAAGMGNR